MLFLAKLPTMIGENHNDRIVCVFTLGQGVQYIPGKIVRIVNGGQVPLYGLLMLIQFYDTLMVYLIGIFLRFIGQVVYIILINLRQLNAVDGEFIIIRLRHIPRQMGPVYAAT